MATETGMEKSLSMKVQWIKKEWATAKNLRNKTTGAVLFLGSDDGRPIVHLDQKDTTREDLTSQSPDWCIFFGKFYARTDIPLSEKPQFLALTRLSGNCCTNQKGYKDSLGGCRDSEFRKAKELS